MDAYGVGSYREVNPGLYVQYMVTTLGKPTHSDPFNIVGIVMSPALVSYLRPAIPYTAAADETVFQHLDLFHWLVSYLLGDG